MLAKAIFKTIVKVYQTIMHSGSMKSKRRGEWSNTFRECGTPSLCEVGRNGACGSLMEFLMHPISKTSLQTHLHGDAF
jgi:hypothetical protein